MVTYRIKPFKNPDSKRCQWCLHTATHEVVQTISGAVVSNPECEKHARETVRAMQRDPSAEVAEVDKAPEGTPPNPKRLKLRPHPTAASKDISKADFKELHDRAAAAFARAEDSRLKAYEAAESVEPLTEQADHDRRIAGVAYAELRAVRHRIGDSKYFELTDRVLSAQDPPVTEPSKEADDDDSTEP